MRYLLIGLLLVAKYSFAQYTDDQYLLKYKEAVQLYASDHYEDSIEKLIPLTSRNYTNDVVPYALYYYALASLKQDKAYQTRNSLRDLMQRFPDWNNIDEAYYLYGYANLKDNYFDEGLSALNKIQSKKLQAKSTGVKNLFLNDLKNVTLLKELNQKFPTDRIIAENLVKRIQERTYNTKADLQLSDLLTNRFQLISSNDGETEKSGKSPIREFDDETIDVGILLPFDLDGFSLEEATKNRYVYDLFAGMQMAEKQLNKEGIPLKLYGFDVNKDATSVEHYLKDPNFKKLDILVGPLYGKPNEVVEKFAEKNGIFQLHPISNNYSLVASSKTRFLIQSSNKSIANAALDYVESLDKSKSVSIYHDGSRDDFSLAKMYAEEATKRGFKINEIKEFIDQNSVSKEFHPGHIFFTSNSNHGAGILRALRQNQANVTVIATASSFNLETINRNNLKKELYLVYPQYVNKKSNNFQTFKKTYIQKMNTLPSYYSFLGYDMILFYGKMMKDGKEIFRLNLDENPQMDDLILSGFDYSDKSSENKVVPIVKYIDGFFEIVNSK